MLAEEAAGIMRLAVADVDLDASIDPLGMDLLMALNCAWASRTLLQDRTADDGDQRCRQSARTGATCAGYRTRFWRASAPTGLSDAENALIAIHGGGEITHESLGTSPAKEEEASRG
jgi:hypothetical protein